MPCWGHAHSEWGKLNREEPTRYTHFKWVLQVSSRTGGGLLCRLGSRLSISLSLFLPVLTLNDFTYRTLCYEPCKKVDSLSLFSFKVLSVGSYRPK